MRYITKNIFLNSIVCPSLGWLLRHDQAKQPSTLGEQMLMDQGMEIEQRARELFPEGTLIEWENVSSSIDKTNELISDTRIPVIFSAFFQCDNYRTKSDILIRKDDDWHMTEVKSSVNDKQEFIEDMAYTTMVMKRCGFNVSSVSLLLVSKDFRLGMDTKALLKEVDHTQEVFDTVILFQQYWERVDKVTGQEDKPVVKLQYQCKGCALFKDCVGKDIENHIFDLPYLREKKGNDLIELGVVDIKSIPSGFPLSANQNIVKTSVQENSSFIGTKLKNVLDDIQWPTFYLDFESINTAIPLFPDVAPYTQIPTQFSIHQCSEPGNIISHTPYLSDPSRDCRRELAEKMINALEGEGSIIVYSNFEKRIINGMINEFNELTDELNPIVDRLVNLETIIRQNVYYPGFHGRTSIKNVAPVLIPEISYDGLEISDGLSAMAVYVYLHKKKYDGAESEVMKESLLKYCELDSYSLLKLHEKLYELV